MRNIWNRVGCLLSAEVCFVCIVCLSVPALAGSIHGQHCHLTEHPCAPPAAKAGHRGLPGILKLVSLFMRWLARLPASLSIIHAHSRCARFVVKSALHAATHSRPAPGRSFLLARSYRHGECQLLGFRRLVPSSLVDVVDEDE